MVEAFQPFAGHFIEEDRDRDGNQCTQDDEQGIVANRVAGDDPGILGFEEVLEILEADQGASQDADFKIDLFKSDDQAGHRDVVVDQQVEQARNHHDVERYEMLLALLFRFLCQTGLFGGHELTPFESLDQYVVMTPTVLPDPGSGLYQSDDLH